MITGQPGGDVPFGVAGIVGGETVRATLAILAGTCLLAAAGCAGTEPVAEKTSQDTIDFAQMSPAEQTAVRTAQREFGGTARSFELLRYEANPRFCRISTSADWTCMRYAVKLDRGRTAECIVRRTGETAPWRGFCLRD